jgi:RNA polymerase sigma-70 factor (ECF subfamily)
VDREIEAAASTPSVQPTDGELLRRMQAGDLDAFGQLFARHRAPIYRTAYGLTGDPHAAEEVLQDTFARAWQRRDTLHLDVSPLPWLHRVALNLCYSRLGRRRLRAEPIEEGAHGHVPDAGIEPAERAEQRELRAIVRDGIAALPPKHQAVVALYYLQGLSLQETAEALGVALGTVKSRLHYALRGHRVNLETDRRLGGAYRAVEEAARSAEGELT